ncbi:sulfotransferase domain-containing protein [Dokdonia ponticola]|uniref:Sulfotransferase domain-containing protein n=1 Tax=Dokdonia ponticola TaxID=2041041 RepID=A0ABV9HY62_9FLAO
MIWLSSFPRSGNTFFRNILFEVYGIPSGYYHLGKKKKLDSDFASFAVVKTHLLPHQLPKEYQSVASIYLIRDGRDACVSLAHHRKELKKIKKNYFLTLCEVILGIGGSFSGGWSRHVKEWGNSATIIIKYEDLIKDPIAQVERLRSIMHLPEPQTEKLPTFQSQKKGLSQYGNGDTTNASIKKDEANKFYRRGIVGSYKDEMPILLQALFWLKHSKQMKAYEYYKNK